MKTTGCVLATFSFPDCAFGYSQGCLIFFLFSFPFFPRSPSSIRNCFARFPLFHSQAWSSFTIFCPLGAPTVSLCCFWVARAGRGKWLLLRFCNPPSLAIVAASEELALHMRVARNALVSQMNEGLLCWLQALRAGPSRSLQRTRHLGWERKKKEAQNELCLNVV